MAGVVQKNLDPNSYRDGRYIVVLAEKPAATYDGGTPGLPATKPEPGKKLDADKAEVKRYEEHLEKKQTEVAGQQNVQIQRQFTAAVNGFSATLTAGQAIRLAKDPAVLVVAPDTENAPDYSSSDFLKLSGSGGTWDTKFGGQDAAGKGVVVGVIDTGYTPSNPFFAGEQVQPLVGDPVVGVPYRTDDGKIAMLKSDGDTFVGACQTGMESGADFDGSACNSKVLSARYFADDFLKHVPAQGHAPQEVLSPVDVDSHGTHTASTAAGNANVEAFVDGRSFGLTSGVAPAAKLSIYKVCWEDTDPNSGGCYSSAAVAAVDQAIHDGVDVLNYSISGSRTTTTDPVSLAFLSATSAGIFVAVSAGNSGPTPPSTVNHGAPWVTTVAASSFSQELQGTVEFSDGSKFRGASIMNRQVVNAGVVLSAAAAAETDDAHAALCGPGTLDPAKVAGKVVVCDRGLFDRVAKSAEVARGGGAGMILVNLSNSSLDTDKHSVPTVHVNPPATETIKAKVAANPALTVSLVNKDTTGLSLEAQPQIAGFSSRGPLLATGSDLLKPDVAAPGVAVLAGVSPIATGGDYGFLSGTSMASPHVAGFGALILAKNPAWSPAVVKSAMMTTAGEIKLANGAKDTDLHATGAGQVDPARVLDPGLVYDADLDDYLAFVQGTGIDLGMPGLGTTKPRDMNVPSFSLGNLTGKIEVTRTLTALTPGTYQVKADVPGVKVSVSPAVLNFSAAGEKKNFKVSFENQGAPLGKFAMGSLTWQGANKNVASPIAVRPQSAVAATDVAFTSGPGTGSRAINVVSGTNGPINMTLDGLSKADSTPVELVPGPFTGSPDDSNVVKDVEVPAGSPLAKFSVFSSDPDADFDMYLVTPTGTIAAATPSASESVSIPNPAPGTYTIYANLYASPGGQATKGSVDASVMVPNVGNATLTPNPLRLASGKSGSVTLNWQGLEVGSYVGRVTFAGASDPTFVSVLVTPAGTVVVPPTYEDQDSNDGPGDSGDGSKNDGKDKDKKVKKEKGKIQNEDPNPAPNNAI
ncbi:subtilisin family serine protease [Arthrobacter sp. V4I6]|uniref:S8 family serine peptidase n=1 Tax=unclassified Arthrobacter TaxID=235627 RepID=UPI00277F21E2|nr:MULTISPECIES: S8 family serine peptidase [unclassified Arthrobacter]MDQ0822917.1 subtilisin family serine protease [Arthrobacter sp. V1I7]MDQ0852546.1 subtilisin family serine protease [Arthrobacter sp. V4I6]